MSVTKKVEVVIVGGGVIGASIVYHLAKSGKKVALVEKEDLASGTSGACSGMIMHQSKRPGLQLKASLESAKLYDKLVEELDYDVEYRKCGGMIPMETQEHVEIWRKRVQEQRNAGLDIVILDGDETRKMVPMFSPKAVRGTTYSPLDSRVNPLNLIFSLTETAKKHGAKIFTQTEVQGVQTDRNKIKAVKTTCGEIETDILVNAAGCWAPKIGKMVNVDIPIRPVKGQMVVTEAAPSLVDFVMISAGFMLLKHKMKTAKAEHGVPAGFTFEPTVNGNYLLGVSREEGATNRNATEAGAKSILRNTTRILPIFKRVNVIRTFAGLRPETPDGLPILGEVEGIDGFLIAAGHGGDGVALAPITGKLLADFINDESSLLPLEKFALARFNVPQHDNTSHSL